MIYKFHKMLENLIVHDEDYFSEVEPPVGDNCFLIVNNTKRKSLINKILHRLLDAGYTYFFFWGEYAFEWKFKLYDILGDERMGRIKADAEPYDMIYFNYEIADIVSANPSKMNFLASDNNRYTEMTVEDLESFFNDEAILSIQDWRKFKEGVEFAFEGRDSVISIVYGEVILGPLDNLQSFYSLHEALHARVFREYNLINLLMEFDFVE